MAEVIKMYDYQNQEPIFETPEQTECYTLTNEIMNDRYTNDAQKAFVENTLLKKTDTTDLQDILSEETNTTMQENLKNLFNLAKNLDTEQLSMVYDEITDFNQHDKLQEDTTDIASIKMKNTETNYALMNELTWTQNDWERKIAA